MKSEAIQVALMSWVKSTRADIVIPNYYLGAWECDLLKIAYNNGFLTEYEIKVSKADFKKDAQKQTQYSKKNKHDEVLFGKRCNRFYFVVPDGMISPEEVPKGMGLIYAIENDSLIGIDFKIIKVSKLLKKDKCDQRLYTHIAQMLCMKLENAKQRNYLTKRKIVIK